MWLRAMTVRFCIFGRWHLIIEHRRSIRYWFQIRTEGTRAGPPEVLKALMEGGPVDPSKYWFHLHVKIETGHERYKWMNDRVIIGRATRAKGEVAYDAYFLDNDPWTQNVIHRPLSRWLADCQGAWTRLNKTKAERRYEKGRCLVWDRYLGIPCCVGQRA